MLRYRENDLLSLSWFALRLTATVPSPPPRRFQGPSKKYLQNVIVPQQYPLFPSSIHRSNLTFFTPNLIRTPLTHQATASARSGPPPRSMPPTSSSCAQSRVHLTVGNRSGYRGNRSYRSGSVWKKLGYRSLTEPSKP
jgi:hypothetical protein